MDAAATEGPCEAPADPWRKPNANHIWQASGGDRHLSSYEVQENTSMTKSRWGVTPILHPPRLLREGGNDRDQRSAMKPPPSARLPQTQAADNPCLAHAIGLHLISRFTRHATGLGTPRARLPRSLARAWPVGPSARPHRVLRNPRHLAMPTHLYRLSAVEHAHAANRGLELGRYGCTITRLIGQFQMSLLFRRGLWCLAANAAASAQ